MSTPRHEPAHLVALRQEEQRLSQIRALLSDMLNAAIDTERRKGFRDCAAEVAKQQYWHEVEESVHDDLIAATRVYYDTQRRQRRSAADHRAHGEPVPESAPVDSRDWRRSR
ncbi:hypothetical protein [Nocardia jejuensis]|uniref:hypothetical protein n=1 Tax=Nocardia jejuensis TaxID=328049 RepID=UPI00082E1470|nr:hypothetical protein [Nocardia jejuensis]